MKNVEGYLKASRKKKGALLLILIDSENNGNRFASKLARQSQKIGASAITIPFDKPNLAAMYALSAQFMGMRFVYLEAGSGAKSNVRPEMVAAVRKVFKGFLIVGGGIRNPHAAGEIVKAGADAIVIGTYIEKGGSFKTIADIVKTIHAVRK